MSMPMAIEPTSRSKKRVTKRASAFKTRANSRKSRQTLIRTKRGISTMLSQFRITDDNLAGFTRLMKKPMDCVINALQVAGVLDNMNANILRISFTGDTGFTDEQIEQIFILKYGMKFAFKPMSSYDEFVQTVESLLQPGYGVLAGYTNSASGHVFVLARRMDGTIVMIDPQSSQQICNINECQDSIRHQDEYNLLFNSPEKLSNAQLSARGFIVG